MGNDVFANGREISCKSADGKTTCAFPDVCMTPPENPATPPGVPVPYPNTGMASDTTSGTTSVKITGKEVMLKNKSYFKQSTGDEAGAAAKKGVVTSVNKGKVYFTVWSMDVKFESENVVRHLDLTTHNHACAISNESIPWLYADSTARAEGGKCNTDAEKEKEACKEYKPKGEKDVCAEAGLREDISQEAGGEWGKQMAKQAAENPCIKARRCRLVPFDAPRDGVNGCCPSQTPDHVIPKASFFATTVKAGDLLQTQTSNWQHYNEYTAPCMCAEGGNNTHGSHGLRHAHHKANGPPKGTMVSFDDEKSMGVDSCQAVFKTSGCTKGCLEAQVEEGHKGMGSGDVKHTPSGSRLTNDELQARMGDMSLSTPPAPAVP